MTTEDDKALREAVRKAIQLPEPDWNLLERVTKRKARTGLLKTPQMQKATATTAVGERFLYDVQADEAAREGGKK